MDEAMVQAPLSLLLGRHLTAAARLLWLTVRAHPGQPPVRLAASSGLALSTIREGWARLEAAGWYSPALGLIPGAPGPGVEIPVGLLAARQVRPQAKLLYGILQAMAGNEGAFAYAALSAYGSISRVTARAAVRELAESGWLQARQANHRAPIRYALRVPELDRRKAHAAEAMRRLEESEYRGEAIMREYLSLLIDSDEFEDNARPGFLVKPLTDERMELDRYYPGVVAFEFNGSQHYRTSRRFPSEQGLALQRARDLMKEALCARRGIQLIVVRAEDLRLTVMQQKVGTRLPLRDLLGHEELIGFLEKVSRSYRSRAAHLFRSKRSGRPRGFGEFPLVFSPR